MREGFDWPAEVVLLIIDGGAGVSAFWPIEVLVCSDDELRRPMGGGRFVVNMV